MITLEKPSHVAFRRPSSRLFGRLVVALLFSQTLGGWVRPALPSGPAPTTQREESLDYVLIHVNGRPEVVRAGSELAVVQGDALEVKDAVLVGRAKVRAVNVVGLQGRPRSIDDKGIPFTTDQLVPRWSENAKGETFAVAAIAKGGTAGAVYIKLIPPVLRYAEISVNGARRVLRDGEPLKAKASDLVKVESVKTNLESTKDVVFQIVPLPDLGDGAFEIRFLRAGLVFARVPLTLERG